MKKTTLPILFLLSSLAAGAEVLTPAQAVSRLGSADTRRIAPLQTSTAIKATYYDNANIPALYAMTMGSGITAILSAESEMPALLGYCDSYFDQANVSPAMRAWLQTMADETSRLRSGQTAKAAAQAMERPAVAPICRSNWNQGSPYNYYCPKVGMSKSMTGCVATAMAQVLYAMQWPAQCNGGTETYRWDSQNTNLSLDFNGITLDWGAMKPNYTSTTTTESTKATALLMQALGYAAHMQYSPEASGAQGLQLSKGLVDHFDFDCTLQYTLHDWYFQDEWEELIYHELQQGNPVYCDGADPVTNSGHAFVIDGYDGQGFFHLNWGWGGMSNGYYRLTALDPTSQGIGGSTGGFNFMQGAILGMVKGASTKPSKRDMTFALLDTFTTSKAEAKGGDTVEFSGTVCNMTPVYYAEAVPSVRFFNLDTGEERYVRGQQTFSNFDMYSGYNKTSIKMPANLTDGNYSITPAIQNVTSRKYYEVRYIPNGTASIKAKVEGGKTTFITSPQADIKVTDVEMTGKPYAGTNITVNALVNNPTSEPYLGLLRTALFSGGGSTLEAQLTASNIEVMPGETKEINVSCFIPATIAPDKNYRLIFFNEAGNAVSTPLTINVKQRPQEGTITCSDLQVTDTRQNNLSFTLDIENTQGYYSNPIYVIILRRSGSGNPLDYFVSEPVTLAENEKTSVTITSTFANGTPGTTYMAAACYLSGNNAIEMPSSPHITFELSEGDYYESGIEQTATESSERYFDLQGRNVTCPAKGSVVITSKGVVRI